MHRSHSVHHSVVGYTELVTVLYQYGSATYWDERYAANPEGQNDEWLVGYRAVAHIVRPRLQALVAEAGAPKRGRAVILHCHLLSLYGL